MKAIKRVQALAMALVMLVSTVVFAGADIQRVSAASTFTLNIHYHRDDGKYGDWDVWTWTPDADGAAYTFDTTDEKGDGVATFQVPVGSSQVGFIIRTKGSWTEKDVDSDQFIPTGDYVGGTLDYYVVSKVMGGTADETNIKKGCVVANVELDKTDYKKVNVTFNVDPSTIEEPIDVTKAISVVDSNDKSVEIENITVDGVNAVVTLKNAVDVEAACMSNTSYKIVFNEIEYFIDLPDYYSSEEFEGKFTYTGNDLGASYTQTATTFKLWAPTAAAVKVNLYSEGLKNDADSPIKTVDMAMEEKGVWKAVVEEDLKNVYYTYEATFMDGTVNEACDPYAKAVGVNGDRAMVVNLAETNPDGWENDKNPQSGIKSYADCSIWEVQVRDFSYESESGVKEEYRGKYLAFTEEGTKNSSGESTCLDYIKQLGVTHVQINPAYDFATVDETRLDVDQYNWGYDPKNYNAPEGSFSTDPYHGEVRIKEFKQMVQSLHNAGIGVVMDVVYNHTYNSDYCFNKIVPGYFYRGTNGSGCGNDVASERAMVSKFIVDSVLYWHKEYHIDGFRFDLVGLIDVDTINEITKQLHEIDPSIILYGEGWTNTVTKPTKEGVQLANQGNCNLTPGFAYFNDSIRDNLKGHVFTATDKGYINGANGKAGDIFNCAKGIANWTQFDSLPLQMINYSSCHDNLTLWDKISTSNAEDTFDQKVKQNNLAAAITFTSQGVPFILAGEEILRTKVKPDGTFDENSYASPSSENSIKWGTLSNAKHKKVLEYYKGIIAFRNAHPALRMSDGKDVDKYVKPINFKGADYSPTFTDGVVQYMISGYDKDDDIIVIYNPNDKDYSIKLPDGAWNVCVQGDKAGTNTLSTVAGTAKVEAVSATILVRGTQKNIASQAKVSGISNKTYTGKNITMSGLKVQYDSKTLKDGKDYTVKYSNNKNAGKASIKITFKGLYKGSVTKTFTIKKASQSISVKTTISKSAKSKPFSLGAKLTKGNGKLSYKVDSSSKKIAKVSSSGKVTLTGKKGTAKITVTAASTSNYNKATKTVKVKVK